MCLWIKCLRHHVKRCFNVCFFLNIIEFVVPILLALTRVDTYGGEVDLVKQLAKLLCPGHALDKYHYLVEVDRIQ